MRLRAMGISLGLSAIALGMAAHAWSTKKEPFTLLTPEVGEEFSGGETTIFDTTANAFGYPVRNLAKENKNAFFVGNSFFKQNWVIAPASASARDGLGPLFNARSCSTCHSKDGRGRPPRENEEMTGMLLRVSIPGPLDPHRGIRPHPVYGDQIQNFAIPGASPEAAPLVSYEEISGTFPDGKPFTLRKPTYALKDPGYGSLGADILISPRVAPQIVGMGLLEAIPEEAILANADPEDSNHDGISGRPNFVWDSDQEAKTLGRFGWKANVATVRQQTAGAFSGDMGITSSVHPQEPTTDLQAALEKLPNGGSPEIEDAILDRVVLYTAMLAVPARREHDDPEVLLGKRHFDRLGCASCHTPKFQTRPDAAFSELANQTIRPYSDLLLHDMGEDLADGRPDFEASGSEWGTPPLWGIGLISAVNGHTELLHDGRARNVEEAILWHGGEAADSRNAYKALPSDDRAAVLRFVQSL